MKTYPYLFNKLFCQPLMLLEPVRLDLESALLSHMGLGEGRGATPFATGANSPAAGDPQMQAAAVSDARVERIYQEVGNVAVVTIAGVIDKHVSDFAMRCYGGCDLADVDRAISVAAADPGIERLVLNVDSPGGSVQGVPETAARVKALTQSKEVLTFVDGMACSAAYFIASQADRIDGTPSAIFGSVGVYCAVLNQMEALRMKGVSVDLIKAGKFKAMGASFKALEPEERAMMQTRVDALHAEFRSTVQISRPQVSNDTMEGQTFDGRQSVDNGLCDGLTMGNLDEYVAALL